MLSISDFKPAVHYKKMLGWVLGDSRQRHQFSEVIQQTHARFTERHPQYVDSLFDIWFLSHQAAPVLTRFLKGGVQDSEKELAAIWEKQMGGTDKGREQRVAALRPAAAEFLRLLEREWHKNTKTVHV